MELSKFFHYKKVDEKMYAVFNSLLMHIAFVDEDTLNRIKVLNLSNEEISNLSEIGVLVMTPEIDRKAHESLLTTLENHVQKISIMYLCISAYCNLACRYCFIEQNPDSTNCRQLMNIDTAKIAVDKFSEQLIEESAERPQIILYGGEPLTNWNLIESIIPYICSKGKNIQVVLITNGTLLTLDMCHFLKQYEVGIGLSLDGPKAINDKYRVFRDESTSVYDILEEKIQLLNSVGNAYSISATITDDIVNASSETIDCFKSLNAKAVFWNLFHYSESTSDWEAFYSKMSQFILSYSDVLESEKIPEGRMMELINNFLSGYFRFQSCAAVGLNQIAVQADGDVSICQGDSRSKLHISGNIITDSIASILNSNESKKWLQLHTLYREECLSCEALFTCGGGCPMQAEVLFGHRYDLDHASCIFYRAVFDWLIQKCYLLSMDDK